MEGDQHRNGSQLPNVEGGGPAPSRDLHGPSSGIAVPRLHDIRRFSSTRLRAVRARTNSPLQALTLLNDPAYVDAADALAKLVMDLPTASDRDRLVYVFRRAVTRAPSAVEVQELTRLLSEFRGTSDSESKAWVSLARVLLNLNEAITKS